MSVHRIGMMATGADAGWVTVCISLHRRQTVPGCECCTHSKHDQSLAVTSVSGESGNEEQTSSGSSGSSRSCLNSLDIHWVVPAGSAVVGAAGVDGTLGGLLRAAE